MRHAIEAGRQASEAFVKALIDDQTEAMIRSDLDSCIMSCNESASRFSGISRLNLIGTRFTPGTPPEAQVRPMAELSFLSPTSLTHRSIDPKHLPNGETRWLEWSNRALFDASGRLTSHLSVARDITKACHAAAACEVLDAACAYLNCWQEGWAGASAAREG
jgi:PAS domain S-box-containing protein